MLKNKYIKVIDANNKESVVLASNESFYKSQGCKIEEPTQEEIEKFFPNEKKEETYPTSETANAVKDLAAEKAAHAETQEKVDSWKGEYIKVENELKSEKDEHQRTKENLIAVSGNLETEKAAHAETQERLAEAIEKVEKLEKEFSASKKK